MAIYTKRGDKGETDLLLQKNISKVNLRLEAIGTIDELNSILGVVVTDLNTKAVEDFVVGIQDNLFTLNSILAGAKLQFSSNKTKMLENKIDELEKNLPPLGNFILPGGTKSGSLFHLARSVCRRAERSLVDLKQKEKVKPQIIIYINRLSDTLFVLSRSVNHLAGKKEIVWASGKRK